MNNLISLNNLHKIYILLSYYIDFMKIRKDDIHDAIDILNQRFAKGEISEE